MRRSQARQRIGTVRQGGARRLLEREATNGWRVITPPNVLAREDPATAYIEMFDKQGLARYFRVSTDTIDRLVKAGLLRAVRIGNQVRFTLEDVEAFIERQKIRGEAA
jgi:excisionase family DNA binding protein